MARSRKPYSLYKATPQRPGDPTIWYFRTYRADGTRTGGASTGIIYDGTERSENLAHEAVHKLIGEAAIEGLRRVRFRDFAGNFWDWETSDYIKDVIARDDQAFGKSHAYVQHLIVRGHLIPYFGPMWIDEITHEDIDQYGTKKLTKDGLSKQTVSHHMSCLRGIFTEAKRKKKIHTNPMTEALKVTARNAKRYPFTEEDARKLLDLDAVETIWASGATKEWRKTYYPWRHWMASAIAATTGRRLAEILALRVEDFDFQDSYVWIRRSIDLQDVVKEGTKTGQGNKIPVDTEIMDIFQHHLPADGWVFPGYGVKNTGPWTRQPVQDIILLAMGRAGISQERIKAELLGFHSWRHYFVSKAHNLPMRLISAVTEHASEESIDRYTTLSLEDKRAINSLQKETIWPKKPPLQISSDQTSPKPASSETSSETPETTR